MWERASSGTPPSVGWSRNGPSRDELETVALIVSFTAVMIRHPCKAHARILPAQALCSHPAKVPQWCRALVRCALVLNDVAGPAMGGTRRRLATRAAKS